MPEFVVMVSKGRIDRIQVVRGAPCKATWEAAQRVKGLSVETYFIKKTFISGKMSCIYIFLDLSTPCTDRHCKTDKNNTPCKDAF